MATIASGSKVETYLGAKSESLLGFKSPKISKDRLQLPGPDFIDRVYAVTDRNVRVLTNLQRMFGHGRLRNAVASTFGVLGSVARKYAHKIPFIVKLNHNELLTYPNKADQVLFGTVKEAHNLGAVAIGATIYFGSDESTRQIVEI